MDLKIISDNNEEVRYEEMIPSTNLFLIEDAVKVFAEGDYGSMLFQQITGNDCSIWYSTYQMTRKALFKSMGEMPVLELHFMFKNDFRSELDGIGKMVMEQYQLI